MATTVDKKNLKFMTRFNVLRGNLSQDAFAKKIGVSRAVIGHYENGERSPDSFILKKIADTCEVSVDWLLGLTDIESGNADDMAVEKRLGLTVGAIKALEKLKRYNDMPEKEKLKFITENTNVLETVNLLLEHEEIHNILFNIAAYVFANYEDLSVEADNDVFRLSLLAFQDKDSGKAQVVPGDILKNIFLIGIQKGVVKLRDELKPDKSNT